MVDWSEVHMIDPILIPMIRRLIPDTFIYDLCSVQPMTGDVGDIFGIRVVPEHGENAIEGHRRHVFGRGWQVYYGTEWIPEDVWIKIKIKGL